MRKGQGLASKFLGRPVSRHSPEAKKTVTNKTPVTRLQTKDPARAVTDEKIAKQITNNPNLKYQPTGVNPRVDTLSASGYSGANKLSKPSAPKSFMSGRGKQIKRVATKIRRR